MLPIHPINLDASTAQSCSTEWVTLTIPFAAAQSTPQSMWIEEQLWQYGEPLRWAITAVDNRVLEIEAVVLKMHPV